MNLSIVAVSETIDATESLNHAVERGEVADQMVRRDVYAHLPSRCANEVDGGAIRLRTWQEAPKDSVFLDQFVSLETSHGPGKGLHPLIRALLISSQSP